MSTRSGWSTAARITKERYSAIAKRQVDVRAPSLRCCVGRIGAADFTLILILAPGAGLEPAGLAAPD